MASSPNRSRDGIAIDNTAANSSRASNQASATSAADADADADTDAAQRSTSTDSSCTGASCTRNHVHSRFGPVASASQFFLPQLPQAAPANQLSRPPNHPFAPPVRNPIFPQLVHHRVGLSPQQRLQRDLARNNPAPVQQAYFGPPASQAHTNTEVPQTRFRPSSPQSDWRPSAHRPNLSPSKLNYGYSNPAPGQHIYAPLFYQPQSPPQSLVPIASTERSTNPEPAQSHQSARRQPQPYRSGLGDHYSSERYPAAQSYISCYPGAGTSDDPENLDPPSPPPSVPAIAHPIVTPHEHTKPSHKMVGKKSAKALSREEGLERTDNGFPSTSWPDVAPINQKNYYTEFSKREDQLLAVRLHNEANREKMVRNAKDKDRALATGEGTNGDAEAEDEDEDDVDLSKIIVIHPGSQNLRVGFASDALPKTVTTCIAYKGDRESESESSKPLPQRVNEGGPAEDMFGEEFSKLFKRNSEALKVDMRANKFKVLPNSKELVVKYNKLAQSEKIPEHNDPLRIEWTDISGDDPKEIANFFTGVAAQRIPDESKIRYQLRWPIQHGVFNEKDYLVKQSLYNDLDSVIENALRNELGLKRSTEWEDYSCVFVIPDLYDKVYVEEVLHICLTYLEFKQVCFIQEGMAASYGAGYSIGCIVDIGAQKTSICCVEDGMVIEDSRVNLKYGGYDVTETFVKMLLHDSFHYSDINLKRRYDFLLAEELKIKCCTMNLAEIAVQLYDFHLRVPDMPTRKYNFKTYDEVILAPMGFFEPSIFDNSEKLTGRRKVIDRSWDPYDPDTPNDPESSAQNAILLSINPSLATSVGFPVHGSFNQDNATPSKEKPNPFLSRMDADNGVSRVTSAAASPAPEGSNSPGTFVFGANGNGSSPAPGGRMFSFGNGSLTSGHPVPPVGMFVDPHARTQKQLAEDRDAVVPIIPLDEAILISIAHAVKGEESDKKAKEFYGGITVIGGGAKIPNFSQVLEANLRARSPDHADKILVGTNPKEMDGQVVTWKGGSVFARMTTNDSWIVREVYEKHGAHRAIDQKVLWQY